MRRNVHRVGQGFVCAKAGFVGTAALCILTILYMASAEYAQPSDPPDDVGWDVLQCTRLEIKCSPSTIDFLFIGREAENLLSPEEKDYLRSMKTLVVENREDVKDFAKDLTNGRYRGPIRGQVGIKNTLHVVGYSDEERVTSFTIVGTLVQTDDGHEFLYEKGFPRFHLLLSQVWPLAVRTSCAGHLTQLNASLREMADAGIYPSPPEWCDAVNRYTRGFAADELYIGRRSPFECPAAKTSHYAMNSECKPDSPKDMVHLFESKAGWNQQGGPELFAFDNHEPKGGCVVLNDGTVTFIHTEGELKQLRWK